MLAAHGFAVIGMNPRGSSGRGLAWAKSIFAHWGEKEKILKLSCRRLSIDSSIRWKPMKLSSTSNTLLKSLSAGVSLYAGRPPVKSAILATDSTMIHYARLHALLTQGSPIHVRIFQDRNEAAKWLGVPIERLAPTIERSD